MPQTRQDPDTEAALTAFFADWPEGPGITARTLAHAWTSGGGSLQVGKVSVRLLGPSKSDAPPFTAGTLHAPRGPDHPPELELCRVLLESHGVSHDDWIHWSDEFADLAHRGFDPAVKFPTLHITDALTPPEVARLAVGLRDLAHMSGAGA